MYIFLGINRYSIFSAGNYINKQMILSPGHPKIDPATRFCLCATCNIYNFGIVKQGNSRLAF